MIPKELEYRPLKGRIIDERNAIAHQANTRLAVGDSFQRPRQARLSDDTKTLENFDLGVRL